MESLLIYCKSNNIELVDQYTSLTATTNVKFRCKKGGLDCLQVGKKQYKNFEKGTYFCDNCEPNKMVLANKVISQEKNNKRLNDMLELKDKYTGKNIVLDDNYADEHSTLTAKKTVHYLCTECHKPNTKTCSHIFTYLIFTCDNCTIPLDENGNPIMRYNEKNLKDMMLSYNVAEYCIVDKDGVIINDAIPNKTSIINFKCQGCQIDLKKSFKALHMSEKVKCCKCQPNNPNGSAGKSR
jgi:hypothetical protein